MRIAVIGATGLVGSMLIPLLGGHEVLVLGRRPSGLPGVTEKLGSAEDWPAMLAGERIDAGVSAIGSTWRKAGSWDVFEQVDRHSVVDFARAALDSGAKQMILISSVGANPGSASEYLAIKGRTEDDLANLGFRRLDLVRPGLLRGPRGGDRRLKERMAIALSPLTNLFLGGARGRFAAIDALQVAKAIAEMLDLPEKGRFVHHNSQIQSLASSP